MNKGMQHTFELTVENLAAFNEYVARSMPDVGFRIGIVVGIFFFLGMVLVRRDLSFTLIYLIVTLCVIATWTVVYKAWLQGRWVRRYAEKLLQDSKLIGRYSIDVKPEGISSVVNGMHAHYPWKSVQQIEQTETHIFVMFDTLLGYVIPKRSFSSPDACTAFFEEIKRFRNTARQGINTRPVR